MNMGKLIICPYFEKEEYPSLYCEMAKITFPSMESREAYLDERCATFQYHACPFAHILDVKYAEKEKRKRRRK